MKNRRKFFLNSSAIFTFPILSQLLGCTSTKKIPSIKSQNTIGRVVIVGGGFGGATAAKYLSVWGNGSIKITLIEKSNLFYSCPMSNLVLGGSKDLKFITHSYDGLISRGVDVIRDEVISIDPAKLSVTTRKGKIFSGDKVIVAPGIDFDYKSIDGFTPKARKRVLHGWKAGPQTIALKTQINSMADGDVLIISIPKSPYRCPPGPYERACLVGSYFKNRKPKSKILLLDANPDVQSKKNFFISAWEKIYKNNIEYVPNMEISELDFKSRTLISQFGDRIKGDVLNVIPPNTSGKIAHLADLVTTNNKWCDVDWLNLESKKHRNIHILGDATLATAQMPKSAHIANQHGKVVAASIIEHFNGRKNEPSKMINTCYSFVDRFSAVRISRVYGYNKKLKTMLPNMSAGGLSSPPSTLEGSHAISWAKSIWADTLS